MPAARFSDLTPVYVHADAAANQRAKPPSKARNDVPAGLFGRSHEPQVTDAAVMATAKALELSVLYEGDETAWLEVMSALAASGRHAEMDYQNLSA